MQNSGVATGCAGGSVIGALHTLPWEQVQNGARRAWTAVAFRYHMPGNTWLVLEQITRLAWLHAVKSPSHAAYATPSEAWLGDHLNLCRETVSDAVMTLEAHGLLFVTRRRPVRGKWLTNLYRMSRRFAAHLLQLRAALMLPKKRRAPLTPKEALGETILSHAPGRGPLGELYERWMQRGTRPQGGTNA